MKNGNLMQLIKHSSSYIQTSSYCTMLFAWQVGGVVGVEEEQVVTRKVRFDNGSPQVRVVPRLPKMSMDEWKAQCEAFGEQMRARGLAQHKTSEILREEDMQDTLNEMEHLQRRRARASRRTLLC